MDGSTVAAGTGIAEFAANAERYCNLIENNDQIAAHVFLHQCAHQLASLYATALELPDLRTASPGKLDGFESYESVRALCERIGAKLGNQNRYWEVFNPFTPEEPVSMTLSEDLTDIYSNLKDGLALLRSDDRYATRQVSNAE